jgi:hypothetical protein
MARIDKGDALAFKKLQPGWTVQSDGFGLNTCSATYKVNSADAPAINVRGQEFPKTAYAYLKAHKCSIVYDDLGVATMRVDYVGIDPTVNSGVRTNPNMSSANGLTAENITSHPNFFENDPAFALAIAGEPPYAQDSPDGVAPIVNGQPAFLGAQGSCFEKKNGGRFIGFVKPEFKTLYGKTQYLANTTSYSGICYYSTLSFVQALYALLGTATSTNSWGTEFPLLPAWAPVGTTDWGHQNLLSQVNVEEFGSLYKVNYEIRYSKEGWDNLVYKNLTPIP